MTTSFPSACRVLAAVAVVAAASARGEDVSVVAIGDVLPGGAYESAIRNGSGPFRNLTALLRGADIALANLETPLSRGGEQARNKKFTFRVPESRAGLLAASGVDVFALGNNHVMDYGPEGLADTIDALSREGLLFCGAGRNLDEARRPARVVVKGVRVAVLSYNRTLPKSFWAKSDRAGTAFAREDRVREDVSRARAENDVVIVMVHWGREREGKLRPYQRPVARAAVEAGAALVIGSHPHVAHGVERMSGAVVAYSLGDGAFGGARRRDADSLVLRARLGAGGLKEVELFSLNASNVDTGYAPAVRTGERARESLEKVRTFFGEPDSAIEQAVSAEGIPCLRISPGAS